MGVEREDVDPPISGGTEPGVGPRANPTKPGVAPPAKGSAAVDFDALHAALGEGGGGGPSASGKGPVANESQGRSSATYASVRPHAVRAAHVSDEGGVPAVIVAEEDTFPGGPPNMTAPMGSPVPPLASPAPMPVRPLQGPSTPQSFGVPGVPSSRPAGQSHQTARMPERPRRPRVETVVVRLRGPSALQKLAVFVLMLLVVSVCGLGIVMWRAPHLFQVGARPRAAANAASPTVAAAPAAVEAPTPAVTAPAISTVVSSPSALPAAPPAAAPPASAVGPTGALPRPSSATTAKKSPKPTRL